MGLIIESRSLAGIKKALTLFNDHNYFIMNEGEKGEERYFNPGHLREPLWFIGEEESRFYNRDVSQFFETASNPDPSDGTIICTQGPEGEPLYTVKVGCAPFLKSPLPDAFRHEEMVFVLCNDEFPDNMIYPSIEDAKNSPSADNPRIQEEIRRIEMGVGKDRRELNEKAQSFFAWRDVKRPSQRPTPEGW